MLLKEKKMVELNRRTFLSGSVAAGAAALFGTEAAHAAGAVKLLSLIHISEPTRH